MEFSFFSKKGEPQGKKTVSLDLFGIVPNIPLLNQYIYIYRTNQRQGNSKVKTRSEVSGGGRKPWQQKHTGRSRQGSIRSPIWRHGGVSHGPLPKNWILSFPAKMRSLALKSALSVKASQGKIAILEDLAMKKPSVKEAKKILEGTKMRGKTLLVQEDNDLNVRKSVSNLPNTKVSLAQNLCAYDVIWAENLLLTEKALNFLEKKYASK